MGGGAGEDAYKLRLRASYILSTHRLQSCKYKGGKGSYTGLSDEPTDRDLKKNAAVIRKG